MNRGGAREGAGRKKKYKGETERLVVYAPAGLVKKLEQYAKKNELSRSEAAVRAIAEVVGFKVREANE